MCFLFATAFYEEADFASLGPIASLFWQNEEYSTGLADIVLDSVICVVDAVFGQQVSERGFCSCTN